MYSTPSETIGTLIAARHKHDYEAAFACYAPDATAVLEKGTIGTGEAAIRTYIKGASDLAITFSDHGFVEYGNIALHTSQYILDLGADGKVPGRTADVLIRSGEGDWKIAIDNPWAG